MFDLSQYSLKVREDFSLIAIPVQLDTPVRKETTDTRDDYANTAEKGFSLTASSRRKIRSAAFGLYLGASRDEQLALKFVTFTFPSLPDTVANQPKVEQDAFLHNLFKKFLDNERNNYDLEKWVWVNERQDGERLDDATQARQVLHYHCLFRYLGYVDYHNVNLRWLNHLRRHGFSIYNTHWSDTQLLDEVERRLNKSDYGWFKEHYESFFFVNPHPEEFRIRNRVRRRGEQAEGRIKTIVDKVATVRYKTLNGFEEKRIHISRLERIESIFLNPVDFSKQAIENIEQLAKYLSPYISKNKENDSEVEPEVTKVYARRWGATRGLVTHRDTITEALLDEFKQEIINEVTGEVVTGMDQAELYKIFTLNPKTRPLQFTKTVDDKNYTFYYLPPAFELWAQLPRVRTFFAKYFKYNLF